jgi:hypothetical protein
MRRLRSCGWTDARPDKLILANSAEIVHYQDIREWRHRRITPYRPSAGVEAHRFLLANTGKVVDGDWDHVRTDFEENEIHRLLYQRFALGLAWEEIEIFQGYVAEVAAGRQRWRHSRSKEELLATSRAVEALYREIRQNGYRTGGGSDEVTVSISRDGELLYNNVGGHHRLSIVKLVGVEKIPVRVLLRHRLWQDLRDEVRSVSDIEKLSARARRYLGHPDLQDLLPVL